MSTRNREKRAAKQKLRRRAAHPPAGQEPPGAEDLAARQEWMISALQYAARCVCGDHRRHAVELLDEFEIDDRALDVAADVAVAVAIRSAWGAGWMPLDVAELARRRLDPSVVEYLLEAVVEESRRYAPATVHPRWRRAVGSLAATLEPAAATTNGPHVRRWARRREHDHLTSLVAVLQVMELLCSLPVLERLLPLPGESRHRETSESAAGDVDAKALAKVRALLAKAESTEFPDEAEALSAKAQELMSRYSLHQAVLDHDHGRAPSASGRRLWLEAPYADAKALLVHEVAAANRAQVVWRAEPGFTTIIGADADLGGIEILTTSLLVQASRAMLAAGRATSSNGTSRTRSFRRSFLLAYATRIGERLVEASSAVVAEIGAAMEPGTSAEPVADARLLPVLAARSRATEDLAAQLFPHMVRRGFSASNGAGWVAGRAAADQARFDVRGAIAG